MQNQKRNYGREFEEEVRSFIENKFDFKDVKGGPSFHIASPGKSNQTDVCGRWHDLLFVFQCKAAGRKTKKSLRDKILETRERSRIILNNYKKINEYANCSFVVFIFITKKIELPDNDIDLLENEKPKIWYADEHTLEYYADLHDKIGKYAIYNFLADFGIRPHVSDQIRIPALQTKLGKYKVYSFYAKPKDLLPFSYVARRRSTKENFYQRMLEKSRINKIKSFLDNDGIFPTNIIISIKGGKDNAEFIEKVDACSIPGINFGTLIIKNSYSACWIVDGQHRLYSYAKSKSNYMIPCIAFNNISVEEERGFFLEINREQRPIQPDLIWDLEGLANPDTSRGIISNIVRTLNNKEPFIDKIYIPVKGTRSGKLINMAAFCNGIWNSRITREFIPNRIGGKNPLHINVTRTMVNRNAGVLERYFSSIYDKFGLDHRKFIFGNAGIPIMLYLLEPIIARIGRIPAYADFKKYILSIKKFFEQNYPSLRDIEKLREESNSEGRRKSIAREIGTFIKTDICDKYFWPTMEESELEQKIIKMERRIGKLILNQLSQITTNWEKQRVDQAIYRITSRKMDKDGTDFDENLDLGDERQIITRSDNWNDAFEKIFLNTEGFNNLKEVELGFEYLSKIRNPKVHGKSVRFTKEDFDLCDIYLQKFNRVVPEIVSEIDNTYT